MTPREEDRRAGRVKAILKAMTPKPPRKLKPKFENGKPVTVAKCREYFDTFSAMLSPHQREMFRFLLELAEKQRGD